MALQHGDRLTKENLAWLGTQLKAAGLFKKYESWLRMTNGLVGRGIPLYCNERTMAAQALNALFLAGVDCDTAD